VETLPFHTSPANGLYQSLAAKTGSDPFFILLWRIRLFQKTGLTLFFRKGWRIVSAVALL
jgi:hypothetical protein